MSDDKKVIFSMVKVNKTTPTGKHILKDIYLSFTMAPRLALRTNGSGKSTVMVVAGLDEACKARSFGPMATCGLSAAGADAG